MDRQVQQKFIKGINRRFNPANQDDPTRLYTLQNARLQQRGETAQVSRIRGYINMPGSPIISGVIHDSIMYFNYLVVLSHDGSTTGRVHIFDVNGVDATVSFTFPATDLGYGKLVLLEDTIFITPYNKQLNRIDGVWYINDFKSHTATITINQTGELDGFLKQNTNYWYMVRVVFQDNHKTTTCFPKFLNTNSKRFARLLITTPPDLDGGFVRLEIFRREEGEGFFLVDRVRVDALIDFEWVDTGKQHIRAFSGENYVWNETESGAAIVRDRLVRAGVSFADRDYDSDASVSLAFAANDYSLVPGIGFSVYARRRFPDGIVSPHTLIDTIEGELNRAFRINQPTAVDSEVAFYMGFNRPFTPEDKVIEFPTLEIYNQNVPSILTSEDPEGDQDRPVNTHIFAGFGQILRFHDGLGNIEHSVRDIEWSEDWAPGPGTGSFYVFDTDTITTPATLDEVMPVYLDIEVVTGQVLKYKRKVTKNLTGTANSGVYELVWVQAIKDYISLRDLDIQVVELLDGAQLSTNKSSLDFQKTFSRVTGYRYLADGQSDDFVVTSVGVFPALLSRLYLIISNDSPFVDYNVQSFNNQEAKNTWNTTADFTGRTILELENIEYLPDDTPTSELLTKGGESYYLWTYNDTVQQPVPNFGIENSVVYLGATKEISDDIYPAGIRKDQVGNFVSWVLPEHAIFETLIQKEDLEIFQENYPTLLVYSEPYVLGTGINGIRNFTFTNFKSISQNYGPILDLQYINNTLLVFCERGVNRVGVGETLTQQASGEVFVSSAQFLTNDFWVLRNLPNIQKESIVSYENMLFFCDGKDVWRYIQQFENITNGSIELDGDIISAVIDPYHKEYRITDQSQTWAFSIELQEWMGPYTYTESASSGYRDRLFGIKSGTITEHNIGNTFANTPYTTIIQSVAIDTKHAAMDKLWRKFLLQLDNLPEEPDTELLNFLYGKEYNSKRMVNIFEVAKKLNLYHIGVHPDHHNSQQLYWELRTDIEDFVLRSFAYNVLIRNRP